MIKHNKILIVGTSCTGKTTLGKRLTEKLELPHFDLDDMHWLPGWKNRPKDEMAHLIKTQITVLDAWIVTGNYTSDGRNTFWKDAQTIIWLDLPLHIILQRYVKRTYRRIRYKELCCNGNIETLGNAIFTRKILLGYILKSHFFTRRPKYNRWMTNEMQEKQWIVCKTKADVERLVNP
jgi:adenylate kinase family enzyme